MPNTIPANNNTTNPLSIGNPTGPGGGCGGGGIWAEHTKLINTNKIEVTVFLFCIIYLAVNV